MKENKKKKFYQKPEIIYEKNIETLAVTCNSTHSSNPQGCQTIGTCLPPKSWQT